MFPIKYIPQTQCTSIKQPWNAICPICKDTKSYQGFNSYECTSHSCKNYSKKHTKNVEEYLDILDRIAKEKEEQFRNSIIPYYSNSYKSDSNNINQDEQKNSHGTYTVYGQTIDTNNINDAYDPAGFYKNKISNNNINDDIIDNDLLNLLWPL